MSSVVAGGGKTLHLPGISSKQEEPPVVHAPKKKKSLFIFFTAIAIINIGVGIIYFLCYPEVVKAKNFADTSAPSGDGFAWRSLSVFEGPTIPLLATWIVSLVASLVAYIIFIGSDRMTVINNIKKIVAVLFIPVIASAVVMMLMLFTLTDSSGKKFEEWAKDKYQLSSIDSFSPNNSIARGKDLEDKPVVLNVLKDGDVYYLYRNKEELLKVATEMNREAP